MVIEENPCSASMAGSREGEEEEDLPLNTQDKVPEGSKGGEGCPREKDPHQEEEDEEGGGGEEEEGDGGGGGGERGERERGGEGDGGERGGGEEDEEEEEEEEVEEEVENENNEGEETLKRKEEKKDLKEGSSSLGASLPSPLYEEDVVDGFSFLSFSTYEDLQKVAKWSSLHNDKLPDPYSVLKFEKEEKKVKRKKKKRETKDIDKLIDTNGDKGSSGSSSEKGFICDSDSDEEKGSENGVDDLFNARKLSGGNNSPCQNGVTSSTVSPTTVSTATVSTSVPPPSNAPPTAIVTPSVHISTAVTSPTTTTTTATTSTATASSKSFFRPYSFSPPPAKQKEEPGLPPHPAYRPPFGSSYPAYPSSSSHKRPYDYSQFIPPSSTSSYYQPSSSCSSSSLHPDYNVQVRSNGNKEEYPPEAKRLAQQNGFNPNLTTNQGYSNRSSHPSSSGYYYKQPSGHRGQAPSSSVSSSSISIHSASSLREPSSWAGSHLPNSSVTTSPSLAATALTPGVGPCIPPVSTAGMSSGDLLRQELDSRFLSGPSPYLMQPRSDVSLLGPPPRPGVSHLSGPSFLSNSLLKDVPKLGASDVPDPLYYHRASSSNMGVKPPATSSLNALAQRSTMPSAALPTTTTSFTTPSVQGSVAPKKSGKWNAMHVRIAWEIYNHQQKKSDKATTGTTPSLSSKTESISKIPHHPPSSKIDPRRSEMMHHNNKPYSAPSSMGSSSRMHNPGHHLLNPFNLRPPLGTPSLYGPSPLDALNPYTRYASPASTANPFGGLGSLRSDPFGFRPNNTGTWPLKSESSLLTSQERRRREEQGRKDHRNFSRDRERNGGSSTRDNSRSPIRSSSLSGSPSSRSNISPLLLKKEESNRPGSVLDMSRPGSSSSIKQSDDCIVVVPPPIASNEGRLRSTTPNGRTSANSNTSRATPTNRPPSGASSRSPLLQQQQPPPRPPASSRAPYGMLGSNNPSLSSSQMGLYGLSSFGMDLYRDPYKALLGSSAYQKDPLREARERELLRGNPLGSMIMSEQDRARMAALNSGYHPPPPPNGGGAPPSGYLGHPPIMNQNYNAALKGTSSHAPPHLGMYSGFPGHPGLPPSLNGHGPPPPPPAPFK